MALGILNQRTVRSFILISFERTMLIVAERFIAYLIDKYGKHPISTEGGTWYYPPQQACQFLKLDPYTFLLLDVLSKGQFNPIHQG